jgi:DNA-binding MarR family transcriptional regulator
MPRLIHDPVEAARRHWLEYGWTDTVGGMTVVASIMRADQIFFNQANALLRPLGLTFPRYEVLGILNAYGSAPLGLIAETMWITPATVTSSVDRLEAAGLCRRVAHPTDARTTLAAITPKGRRVFERALEAINTEVFAAVPLSDDEAQQLVELIDKIRRNVGDVVGVALDDQAASPETGASRSSRPLKRPRTIRR